MPDAKSGILSAECNDAQESRGAGTRSCASSRSACWQRGGQLNLRRKRASSCAEVRTGSVWTTAQPSAHAGDLTLLLQRRGVRTLVTRRNYQTALGTLLKFVKERALSLVEGVEIDGALVAYSNDCFVQGAQHHQGSQLLAAVMDRWPSFSRFGSKKLSKFHRCLMVWRTAHTCTHPTSNACSSLRRQCNTTRPSQ